MTLSRRAFTKLAAGSALAAPSLAAPFIARGADMPMLTISEPLHGIGYLPLYAAISNGYFEQQGFKVRVLLTESGAGHTNAVLSGDAFGFIGGPEHNAYAYLKGAQLRSVVNIVNRSNNYLVTVPGAKFDPNDMAGSLRGKTLATAGLFGSTLNSTARYLCVHAGLKLPQDVRLLETSQAGSLAALKAGQAQLSMANEPLLTEGVEGGIWSQPVWSGPQAFGDYAYTAINVPKETIDKKHDQVAGFVKGMVKGLQFVLSRPPELNGIIKKEFPTMSDKAVKATLDRYFADQLWSPDGKITEAAWDKAEAVVIAAGLLKQKVDYKNVIDPEFT
ncbi:MAG TPA: ABC transporter substrate-binding protein [Stellaceae bacterium]|jgi:NitT/TauT family transport system substrate-binding protein|nr:ABC transporter substrate-binding protein [Stellaceae bacterium]